MQVEQKVPGQAIVTLQETLSDARVRLLNVATEDGHRSIRADLLIGDRLGAILKQNGRELYASYDQEARQLLERGRLEKEPRLLEEVGRSYPAAESAILCFHSSQGAFPELYRSVSSCCSLKVSMHQKLS